VSIRIEEVEEIFNRFAGGAPAYHKMTPTTMTPLRRPTVRSRSSPQLHFGFSSASLAGLARK